MRRPHVLISADKIITYLRTVPEERLQWDARSVRVIADRIEEPHRTVQVLMCGHDRPVLRSLLEPEERVAFNGWYWEITNDLRGRVERLQQIREGIQRSQKEDEDFAEHYRRDTVEEIRRIRRRSPDD